MRSLFIVIFLGISVILHAVTPTLDKGGLSYYAIIYISSALGKTATERENSLQCGLCYTECEKSILHVSQKSDALLAYTTGAITPENIPEFDKSCLKLVTDDSTFGYLENTVDPNDQYNIVEKFCCECWTRLNKDNRQESKGSSARGTNIEIDDEFWKRIENKIPALSLAAGAQESPGERGAQGLQGERGGQGARGRTGAQGLQGLPGPPGSSNEAPHKNKFNVTIGGERITDSNAKFNVHVAGGGGGRIIIGDNQKIDIENTYHWKPNNQKTTGIKVIGSNPMIKRGGH